MQNWYLVRTKAGAERVAQDNLRNVVDRTLLPMGRMRIRQGDRTIQRVSPIFPSYLFASFSLASTARRIRYTPGVRDIVRFGDYATVVPDQVIDELMLRCADGPVDLSKPALIPGSPLEIVGGPFREFRAVFEGYLSGSERVAVLLSLMNAKRRVVMPAGMVVPAQ
jgi:transcriptional antiterminator RfaH